MLYPYYNTVIRPKTKIWKDILLLFLSLTAILSALIILYTVVNIKGSLFVLICIICGFAYLVLAAKKLLLTLITLYQKYAPTIVSSSCLFEHCCSEYMKISVFEIRSSKRLCKLPLSKRRHRRTIRMKYLCSTKLFRLNIFKVRQKGIHLLSIRNMKK